MMRGNDGRLRLLIVGSGVVLLALVLLIGNRDTNDGPRPGPPLSMHASTDGGARGLALWLNELGYRVEPFEYRRWGPPDDIDVLFILSPTRSLTPEQAATTRTWVERGGHLIIGMDWSDPLLEELGLGVAYTTDWVRTAQATLPLAGNLLGEITVETNTHLVQTDASWVSTLSNTDSGSARVIGTTRQVGSGQVHVLTSTWVFSNLGIREADNAALILSLLGDNTPGARVMFDEYHHGRTEHGTLTARLFREPWGWAILYAFAIAFIWIAWGGVRFGQPLRAAPSAARRTSGEYITTLAGALRRNRQHGWLQTQYAAQVRRNLARRYRVGRHSDQQADVLAQIIERQPRLAGLEAPLRALERGTLSEADARQHMHTIDQILRDTGNERPGVRGTAPPT